MSQNEKLEQQIENKEEIQKELQRKIEVLEKDLAKPCAQCANYESQVVKLQSQLKVRYKDITKDLCVPGVLTGSQNF